jgi:hypothetical protein
MEKSPPLSLKEKKLFIGNNNAYIARWLTFFY